MLTLLIILLLLAALGGGPVIRNRVLKLRPLQERYVLDHPQLVASEKRVDGEGKVVGVTVTATTEELHELGLMEYVRDYQPLS